MTANFRSTLVKVSVLLAAVGALAVPAAAQTEYQVLHAFKGLPGNSRAPLLVASNGWVYGTTTAGGHGRGAVFVLKPGVLGGFGVTTLHEFTREEGGVPYGGLIEGPDSALYGTTSQDGPGGRGTIFRITPAGALSVLHAFSGPDGATPIAALTYGPDGNFYGRTALGGASNLGTIFRMTPAGAVTTLFSFLGGLSADVPLVRAADGHLYAGSTLTIYRVTLDGAVTPAFDVPGSGLVSVHGLIQGSDGHLYGVSRGPFGPATFFRLTLAGEPTLLYSTNFQDGDSLSHVPLAEAADGSMYGTLPLSGPNNRGTAFTIDRSGAFTVLHAFTPQRGTPQSGLALHPNGLLYGTTFDGGLTNRGLLYSIATSGLVVVRHHFTDVHGDAPMSAPVPGPDGALYGTTARGGLLDLGIVYRLAASGELTVLHSFNGSTGAFPWGGLVRGSDGLFYGTAVGGGVTGRGTIFRISATGVLEVLHTFTSPNGREPYGGLMQATDGQFWGTTARGGVFDLGTAFRMTPAGVVTTVHHFGLSPSREGYLPAARLLQGQDGLFYGTTYASGSIGNGGTVFRMTPAGSVTTLHTYQGNPGGGSVAWRIVAGVVEGSDGTLYGSACCLQDNPPDSPFRPDIFRITPAGYAPVHLFSGSLAALADGGDGAFYGASLAENNNGNTGTVFRLDADGTATVLKALLPEDGVNPSGFRAVAPGEFVGTAVTGGPSARGVVFRVRTGSVPDVP